jgi:uncharacterized protein YeeX (DUF496 family)
MVKNKLRREISLYRKDTRHESRRVNFLFGLPSPFKITPPLLK